MGGSTWGYPVVSIIVVITTERYSFQMFQGGILDTNRHGFPVDMKCMYVLYGVLYNNQSIPTTYFPLQVEYTSCGHRNRNTNQTPVNLVHVGRGWTDLS